MSHFSVFRPTMPSRLVYAAFLGVLLSASSLLADGLFLPEQAVEKTPTMPVQRAVVTWKDGVETLILSPTVDSDAEKLGWLIPIPAAPLQIEQQTPGGIKTLVSCVQPQIADDLGWENVGVIAIAFVGSVLLAIIMFKKQWLYAFLGVLFAIVLVATLVLSTLGNRTISVAPAAAMQGEKTARVSPYEIALIKPKAPADVNQWLAQNGFAALPPGGDQRIAEYIQGDWQLVAVKLARAASGASTPPPVEIVFNAKEAVYPLRLSALASGKSDFEIFVLADRRASCDLLQSAFCDRFERRIVPDEPLPFYQGEASAVCVGNTSIRRLMWNGCVLTKLAGPLDADKMTADIRFAWKPFDELQDHFYTPRGALQSASFYFAWFAGTWACLSMLACKRRIGQPKGGRWYVGVVLLPAVALCAIGAAVFYQTLPKLNTSDIRIVGDAAELDSDYLHLRISRIIKAEPDLLQKSQPEIVEFLLAELSPPEAQLPKGVRPVRNRATGGPIAFEDSPGNFTLEKKADKVIVRVYDRFGQSWASEYPITGDVQDRPKGTRERR